MNNALSQNIITLTCKTSRYDYSINEDEGIEGGVPFVGLIVRKNQISFYYPEEYRWTLPLTIILDPAKSDYKSKITSVKAEMLPILHSIGLAPSQSFSSELIEKKTRTDQKNDPLISYVYLIQDYLRHGERKGSKIVTQANKGHRVNWVKTGKQTPLLIDDAFVYPTIYYFDNIRIDTLLTSLYLSCVKLSARLLGWLYGLNSQSIDASPLEIDKKNYYIDAIRSALQKTYQDDRRIRLNHMLQVISSLGDLLSERSLISYGTCFYNVVYEKMIDQYFGGLKDITMFYPKGYWMLTNKSNPQESTSLRPDTIVKVNDKELLIIDAKYYSFPSLPSTQSIEKQITYLKHANTLPMCQGAKIYNVFILPRNITSGKTIEYLGYAYSDWYKDTRENRIYSFYLDLKTLIENYHSPQDSPIDEIKNVVIY
jgi:hypothetical protein